MDRGSRHPQRVHRAAAPPRLIGRKPEDLLTELFGESVAAAEEITEALGTQVRRAVELLVQAMSEAAIGRRRRGEPDPLPADRDEVYQAAVTVMMRVVFLLFAEERGLLPQGRLFTGDTASATSSTRSTPGPARKAARLSTPPT